MTKIPTWKKQGFKSYAEYRNYLARQKGFESYNEYVNYLTQKKGCKSYYEHRKQQKTCKILKKLIDGNIDSESLFTNIDFIKKITKCDISKSNKLKKLFKDNK